MIDHRIVKLRFLFATLYCAIMVCFFPGLGFYVWWIPLGLFMPVIAGTAPCATKCNPETQTDEIEITFTGIANGSCTDCAVLNRTIIVPFIGGCTYNKNTTGVTYCSTAGITLTTRFAWDSSINGIDLFDYSAIVFAAQSAAWDPAFSTPRDCNSAPFAISIPPDTVSGTAYCNFTSCTATAIPTGNTL